jgi:hypothetical protein
MRVAEKSCPRTSRVDRAGVIEFRCRGDGRIRGSERRLAI